MWKAASRLQLCGQKLYFLAATITCLGPYIMTQQQSNGWTHKDPLPPNKFSMAPSSGKVMLIQFFDSKGIILQYWVLQTQTVNGEYCEKTLKSALQNEIWCRGGTGVLKVTIAFASRQCIATYPRRGNVSGSKHRWNINKTIPYSPDLTPSFLSVPMSYVGKTFTAAQN